MADKPKWQNHPAWYLLLIVPQLMNVMTEDDAISRFLGASSLVLLGFLGGQEWAKRAAWRRGAAGGGAAADKRRQWRERRPTTPPTARGSESGAPTFTADANDV